MTRTSNGLKISKAASILGMTFMSAVRLKRKTFFYAKISIISWTR